jgi:hypothetical protein
MEDDPYTGGSLDWTHQKRRWMNGWMMVVIGFVDQCHCPCSFFLVIIPPSDELENIRRKNPIQSSFAKGIL